MNENDDFKKFCEKNINNFTNYLNHINCLRNDLNYKKFSSDEIEFFNTHFELSTVIVISNLDNIVIIKNLNFSNIDWEVRFFLKKLYLNIYETFQSIDSYNKFIMDYFCVNEGTKKEYLEIKSKFKVFRKMYKYDTEIRKIRNVTAGHIHNLDFNLYFETLSNLNSTKSINMGIEFMSILNTFDKFLLKNFNAKSQLIKYNKIN